MVNASNESDRPQGEPEIDIRIQEVIGRSLKAHYDDIVASPMPDRFLVLLSELEAKEQQLAARSGVDV